MNDLEKERLNTLVTGLSKESLEYLCSLIPLEIVQNQVSREIRRLKEFEHDISDIFFKTIMEGQDNV